MDYLTEYASRFELPVELDSRVHALRRIGRGFRVALEEPSYTADQVVIATGPFQAPFVPAIADGLDQDVFQLHNAGYRAPGHLPAGPVLGYRG